MRRGRPVRSPGALAVVRAPSYALRPVRAVFCTRRVPLYRDG
ncbi:hypothetical protein ACWGH3_15385 [Streptomyces sp. NPDC054884]|nr:hypothetical protein [Streptomyces sp. ME08-AFT2]MDX3314081.1 hypothetical protein [Streptomyces sp. ME08-AFT2]